MRRFLSSLPKKDPEHSSVEQVGVFKVKNEFIFQALCNNSVELQYFISYASYQLVTKLSTIDR